MHRSATTVWVVKKLAIVLCALSLFAAACGSDDQAEFARVEVPAAGSESVEVPTAVVEAQPTPDIDAVSTTDVTPITERFEDRLRAVRDAEDWCAAAAILEVGVEDLDRMDVRDTLSLIHI